MSRSFVNMNLPSLDYDDSTMERSHLLSQTFSREHLVSNPQETFSAAKDLSIINAEELHDAFIGIFNDHAASACLDQEVEKYAEATDQAGNMLHELSRQLENAGRRASDIRNLSNDILGEAATWKLLHSLILNKDTEVAEGFVESAMFSEKEAKRNCYHSSQELRHLKAVLDWLEASANFDENHFTNRVNPDNTFHQVKLGQIEVDLNPDVQVKDLHVLDQQALAKFNGEIFRLIRCGDLPGAIEKCVNSGQSFKAALLEGAVLYHNPNIQLEQGDIEGVEMRDLWKKAAFDFTESATLPLMERGIIGAICGNSEPLLQLSQSWEDRLWSLLTASIDVAIERSITESVMGEHEKLPDFYWKQSQPVENLLQKAAATGSEQKNIFRRIQEILILDDFEELGLHIETLNAKNKHQARFLAHLSMVLQSLGVCSITAACIEKFAKIIVENVDPDGRPHEDAALVARYCHLLEQDMASSIYSQLLVNLSCMNHAHRERLINLAQNAGLSVNDITKQAAVSMQQANSGETDLNALEILLANKDLSSSFNIACSLIKNMIVMKNDEAARIAVKKMEDVGAENLKNNEPFLAIRCHLNAMDLFGKWSRLFNSSGPSTDMLTISSSLTFVQRINVEQQNEVRLNEILKTQRELQELAKSIDEKVTSILTTSSSWFDDDAKSVIIPMLVVASMKAQLGSKLPERAINTTNLLMSSKYGLYNYLNTQTARSVIDLAAEANSMMLKD